MFAKKLIQFALLAAICLAALAPTSSVQAGSTACGGSVTVVKGDTLRKIAERCGTTVAALQMANGLKNINLIYPGQVLVMPGAIVYGAGGYDTYVVARGDTLKSLAARFNTSMDTLLALNKSITNANVIYEGQRLTVPAAGSSGPIPPPPPSGGQLYTVQRGDTLRIIAARYNTSMEAILKANPQISNANLIYAGQRIALPSGVSVHVVQRGDTLRAIAARYGTSVQNLLALNPAISDANKIYPGQVIRLW